MHIFIKLYHRERYLIHVVSPRFRKTGKLTAFDFFCIVIWKANRSKLRVAQRLLQHDPLHRKTLMPIVADLARQIHRARESKERLRILMEDWGLRLPMASAILTVLYPNCFTIYDVRVCNSLGNYHTVQSMKPFDRLWDAYRNFRMDVKKAVPRKHARILRDKDRYLWGKSFARDLALDIRDRFLFNADKRINKVHKLNNY